MGKIFFIPHGGGPLPLLGDPNYARLICVFDPVNIVSNCSARHPRRYASGIEHVLVNGQFSMRDGRRTDVNAGRVLRSIGG